MIVPHLSDSHLHALLVVGPVVVKSLLDGVVGSLDSPAEREARDEKVSNGYRFWFRFLNYFANNWKRAKSSLPPQP